MWVMGFAAMIDTIDQYIVRGVQKQLELKPPVGFGVNDTDVALLFSAFILVNGVVTLPAGFLGDHWNRTKMMAVTITAWSVISAMGGLVPTAFFGVLLFLRASLGFGQAVTDPSASSLIGDYYGTEQRGRAFSIQQCLTYVGLGLGLAIGGTLGPLLGGHGWRIAFGVSILPGLAIAYMCWRLPEPNRGTADRAHVTHATGMEMAAAVREPLFPDGFWIFLVDMVRGLRTDVVTILRIPTMRYALIGVSTILFTVTAVATWMPTFYQNQLGFGETEANVYFAVLAIGAGIPGTLIGGRMADRWANRFMGARVVIPAVCIATSAVLFMISFLPMPSPIVFGVQLLGFLAATASVPPLRAGLTDSVPAHLRGTGFGAFNLASVVFGAALAPIVTAIVATQLPVKKHGVAVMVNHHVLGDYRTAFLIVMPIAFVGTAFLLQARKHIETDAAKIFEAVVAAMAAEQAAAAAHAAGHGHGHGHDQVDGAIEAPTGPDRHGGGRRGREDDGGP
jgi:MFS family permease